jgi:hypothetical protein
METNNNEERAIPRVVLKRCIRFSFFLTEDFVVLQGKVP